VKALFIGSTLDFSGKRLVALGVAQHFVNKGLKVGYFKPIGVTPVTHEGVLTEEDAVFFKKELSLKDDLADICPVVLTSEMMCEIYEGAQIDVYTKILNAYKKIARDKDIVIIGGTGSIYSCSFISASQVDLIKLLDAKAIIIDRYDYSEKTMVDALTWTKSILGDALLGVVMNMIPKTKEKLFRSHIVPFLQKKNIETVGFMHEDPILHSLSVKEIVASLDGKVVCCEDQLDNLVERVCVGAMTVTSALKYFKNIHNKAVITGGDRGELQLAALETSTRCLILTGDLQPHNNIVMTAMAKKVPIIVVPYDTLTTADKFTTVLGHVSLKGQDKIDRALSIVNECVQFDAIDAFVK